ncbi:MAG: hypothetical protein JEZ07_10290 [Phycisphaerae bacterium]|nr:hypothetical protein [Phycisphaerae bacterium]
MMIKPKFLAILLVLIVLSTAGAQTIRHRFLAKDESRSQLHYVNQLDPSQDWTIKLEKGCRDIRLLGKDRVLVSFADGYGEYDLNNQQQLIRIKNEEYRNTETATRLDNGNTILGANRDGITFFELDPAGEFIRKVNFPNLNTIRLMRLSPEGNFMFGANTDHVIEANWQGEILVDFTVEGAKHIYWVKKLEQDRYRISTGYGATIEDITTKDKKLKRKGNPKKYNFFSRPFELDNDNIVVSHWTGHGYDDSVKGPQILEFDSKGKVVWQWHDPKRAGTIHGVIVLDQYDSNADRILRAQLRDFDTIKTHIEKYHPSHWAEYEKVASEALRKDAIILESDTNPVDVILRRTEALKNYLKLTKYDNDLQALKELNTAELNETEQQSLFVKISNLRRKIAFSNPLLDFDSLLFIKRNQMARGESHMVDQYMGMNQSRGGGVYRLDNIFSGDPGVTDLLANNPVQQGRLKGKNLDFNSGAFISLDLDYDANKILFAFTENNWELANDPANWINQPWTMQQAARYNKHYCWDEQSSFHIFSADADGKNLKQLTDGQWDDFDPFFLPNERIGFISSRAGGNQRCGGRFLPTYTLHAMQNNGDDIIQLSWHDTNEWHPSIDNNGMIIYSRWDYVDRDSDIAHHLWYCYPDGRDPRSMHGNYPDNRSIRPWMELHNRAIPESHKCIGVATPHHGESYGSLVLIDQSIPDDRAMSQLKRITPMSPFPESEISPGKSWRTNEWKSLGNAQTNWPYSTPWPLSEDFYLCVYAPGAKKHGSQNEQKQNDNYGIYLVDSFGNRELIYEDPKISCLDPIPFKPRKRPPVIPTMTIQAKADQLGGEDLSTGTITVMNVYEAEIPIPKDIKIKEMRIINVFPKPTHEINNPRIGHADQSLARGVFGTVPVEADGSVYFKCPTGAGIYFQLLDENGLMVQNMRSDTYLHPGENLTCIGCHENKGNAPKSKSLPVAMKRQPSIIKPEASGSYPLTFPRLVQPVLDKHCMSCHEQNNPKKSLRGDKFGKNGWSEAMLTLSPYAWGKHGGNGAIRKNNGSYSIPMQEGARVSKLYKHLSNGHKNVKLSAEEMRRITLWLDANSNFYGAYKQIELQAQGQIAKPLEGLPEWTDFDTLKK